VIARNWRGRIRRSDADAYVAYLRATGVADYRAAPGNAGVLVLQRDEGDETEIVFLSLWESEAALLAEVGDETARYYPEDDRFLLDREPLAPHFRVRVDERPGRSSSG
jgi:quinol monooxygenase YgiN